MGLFNITKQALILGGSATVGIFAGLVAINRKELIEEKKNRAHIACDESDEICFDDLNKGTRGIRTIDDSDVDYD